MLAVTLSPLSYLVGSPAARAPVARPAVRATEPTMKLGVDLTGKTAFVAGVGDSTG